MKRNLFGIMLLSGISILPKANAQTTYEEMEQLTVNEQITTVITASEPVRFVDISTDKVAGDQPIDNIIRLKPKESGHEDGENTRHRHHCDGTIPHTIRTDLYHKDERGSNG